MENKKYKIKKVKPLRYLLLNFIIIIILIGSLSSISFYYLNHKKGTELLNDTMESVLKIDNKYNEVIEYVMVEPVKKLKGKNI